MLQQIQEARMLSAKLRRLLEAKQAIGEIIYVKLAGDIFIIEPIKEALARLEGKILKYRNEVKRSIESVPGYDKNIHWEVTYLSIPDIKSGIVNLSSAEDGGWILNLETGLVVSTKLTD